VPTITVSVIDLMAELEQEVTVKEINTAFALTAVGPLAGILGYTDLPLVSSDFRGDSHSSIVDGLMTAVFHDKRLVRVVCWYDNEWGYASRVVDVANFISECEFSGQRPERVWVVEREKVEQALHSLWL
jgi:glyceraldehyde 3-phosphate dehydrogenase